MRILLTGANGFIGPNLANALLANGHDLTCPLRRLPQDHLPSCAVRLVEADLTQPVDFGQAFDIIVHCAGTAPASGRPVTEMVADNLDSTRSLVEMALRRPPRLFLFFSTMSVYREVRVPVVDESTPVIMPSAYGMSKLVSEELLLAHREAFPSVALRLPAILGPGASGHWLSMVLARARRNEPIEIFNPSAAFNNAVYLDDLVTFVCELVRQSHEGFERLTLSLANALPIETVVRRLLRAAGSTSPVDVVHSENTSFTIDASRARQRFGFRSRSCEDAIEWYASSPARGASGAGSIVAPAQRKADA